MTISSAAIGVIRGYSLFGGDRWPRRLTVNRQGSARHRLRELDRGTSLHHPGSMQRQKSKIGGARAFETRSPAGRG